MSAYKDAFGLYFDSPRERISTAAAFLRDATTTVIVEGWVALRPTNGDGVLVEVIDRADSSGGAVHYEDLIAQARSLLENPLFACLVNGMQLDWLVVQDYGTGTVQVWPPISEA